MRPLVYLLLGDGGYALSGGFVKFGQRVEQAGCEVTIVPDSGRDTSWMVRNILAQPRDRKLHLWGYSLGACGAAWGVNALLHTDQERMVESVVGWDPTLLSALWGAPLSNYPIGRNVKRCLCFVNTWWLSPSSIFGFGHAVYKQGAGGPQIEVTKVWTDHLLVQFDKTLQNKALGVLI